MSPSKGAFDLTGKVALVTGANSGIGLGFARGIAEAGGDVVIWGRREERNAAAARELAERGVRVQSRRVDVSSEQQVRDGFAAALDEMGRVDCVIANAGIATLAPSFAEMSTELYQELLATNLHGAFFTLRAGAAHMVEMRRTAIPVARSSPAAALR